MTKTRKCWRCDVSAFLEPDGTEPGGIRRYACSSCCQVTRFDRDGNRLPAEDRGSFTDTQGNTYTRED